MLNMESQTNPGNAIGQLFIVATPIGNLGDITYRAVEILKSVDLIAAEDTRRSRKLLHQYRIDSPMIALHEHNEESMANVLLQHLRQGKNIALVSDAGTPLISDPGYRVVHLLRRHGIRIVPIPGPSSILAALCASGLPTDAFTFYGFLRRSGKARRLQLQRIAESPHTSIVLESPRRLEKTIRELMQLTGADREACLARELTKFHEQILTRPLGELAEFCRQHPPRGECVLLVSPGLTDAHEIDDARILEMLSNEDLACLPPSSRARKVAEALQIPKARVYRLLMQQT